MNGIDVIIKNINVKNPGYNTSKTSAIKNIMIAIYTKILNMLNFLFSEAFSISAPTSDVAFIIYLFKLLAVI